MRRRFEDLAKAYKEKTRLLSEAQERSDRIKRKAELGQMQAAANNEIDTQLGVPSLGVTIPQRMDGQGFYEQQSSAGNNPARQHTFATHGSPGGTSSHQRGYAMFPNTDMAWRAQNVPEVNSGG